MAERDTTPKREAWTPRSDARSELVLLRNQLLAQIAEVDMAIQRLDFGSPMSPRPVTLESKTLLHKAQGLAPMPRIGQTGQER